MSKFEANNIGNNLIKVNGNIKFKLAEVLEKNNLNKYRLSKITNIRYDTICNYCKGNVTLINVEYLKIFCNVLNCKIEDIIEYVEQKKRLISASFLCKYFLLINFICCC